MSTRSLGVRPSASTAATARDRRSAEILTKLGLAERITYKPHALSGGRRQRVAVARALVNRPKLILADEPTAALDRKSGRDVVTILKSLAEEEQATILIVTHDTRILDVADRIITLIDGRIASDVAVKQTVRIVEFLQKCPIFAQQPVAMLAEFAALVKREAFDSGEVIIRRGEVGDKFYIIESGVVDVSGEKEGVSFTGVTLTAGDFFGGL
jgi:putative ABC transport system ATP-binding protein